MLRHLDTCILIDCLRGYPPALEWFKSLLEDEAPAIPGVVAMELIHGCRSKAELTTLTRAIGNFRVHWPSEEAANTALAYYYENRLSSNLSPNDALIGVTAKERNAVLLTHNLKDYALIDGLNVEVPYPKAR